MRELVAVQAVVTSLVDDGADRYASCGHLAIGCGN